MTDPKYMREGYWFAVGKLVEELGELQQVLGKTLRFGPDSYNPEVAYSDREYNSDMIAREIEDVLGAIENYQIEENNRIREKSKQFLVDKGVKP